MEPAAGYLVWPTRFPIARVAALFGGAALTAGLVWGWTSMDLARFSSKCGPCARLETNGRPVAGLSTLEKFYWRDYVKVTVKNLLPDHIIPDIPMLGHKRVYPPIPEHTVVVMGDKLATAETLGPGWKIQRLSLIHI